MLNFYLSHPKPSVVIASGIHGDEWEIVELLERAITQHKEKLPPFLFIPTLSPSACKLKSRVNSSGLDLNRFFDTDSKDLELLEIKKLMRKYMPYEKVITFHQDLDREEAYIYDGYHLANDQKIKTWQAAMRKRNISLLNQVDNPEDKTLNTLFTDGYFNFHPTEKFTETFETWSSIYCGVKRNLTIEIPGKLTKEKQNYIIEQSLLIFI